MSVAEFYLGTAWAITLQSTYRIKNCYYFILIYFCKIVQVSGIWNEVVINMIFMPWNHFILLFCWICIIPFSIDAVIFLHYHHFPFDRNNCGSDPNGNSVGTWCIAVEWYAWMHAGIENTIQLVQGPSTMTKRRPMADRLKWTEKAKR